MMVLTKVISSAIEETFRMVKVLRFGKDDIQVADNVAPYGVDSNPVKDMTAVFSDTVGNGEPVIVGYINQDQLAAAGEIRIYSTDSDGAVQMYAWLKANGTMELGGNAKHLARYEELKTGFDQLKQDFNALVTKFNAHTHAGVTSGSSATAAPATPATASSADISGAKINEIKTL